MSAFTADRGPDAKLRDLESWVREQVESSGTPEPELKLLVASSTMYLDPSTPEAPLKPRFVTPDGRTTIPDDFSEDEVAAMVESIDSVVQNDLRARIGDIAWTRCKNYKGALGAIDAYLALAGEEGIDMAGIEALEKSARIAASLGPTHAARDKVQNRVAALISHAPAEPSGSRARLLELGLMFELPDPGAVAALAEGEARLAESNGRYTLARLYWGTAGQWHGRAEDEGAARLASINGAETYMLEAKPHIEAGDQAAMVAALFISDAITALRSIPGTKKRRDELHRELVQVQESGPSSLASIKSDPVDLSVSMDAARRATAGKPFREGLFALASVNPWPSATKLRDLAIRHAEQNFISSIFSPITINESGKVVAKTPSSHSSDADDKEAAIRHQLYRLLMHEVEFVVHGAIEPARRQLVMDHPALLDHVLDIVRESPLVPPGREILFAQGLHAGLHGEFSVAAHVLVPQVEHAIRHILYSQGITASSFTQEGIQPELDLNRTLYLEEAATILGDDLSTTLRGLIVEQVGANFRNRLAHGLSGVAELYGYPSIYTWWLALGVCLFPLAKVDTVNRKAGGEQTEA
ncbi:MAG: DUF4209 domain-containing protein [Acidobacteriota bacterium]